MIYVVNRFTDRTAHAAPNFDAALDWLMLNTPNMKTARTQYRLSTSPTLPERPRTTIVVSPAGVSVDLKQAPTDALDTLLEEVEYEIAQFDKQFERCTNGSNSAAMLEIARARALLIADSAAIVRELESRPEWNHRAEEPVVCLESMPDLPPRGERCERIRSPRTIFE